MYIEYSIIIAVLQTINLHKLLTMEAMTLGSPQSPGGVPVSPGAHGVQSPFLPPYLMGESTPAANTVSESFSDIHRSVQDPVINLNILHFTKEA